jgi:hypothetical protein
MKTCLLQRHQPQRAMDPSSSENSTPSRSPTPSKLASSIPPVSPTASSTAVIVDILGNLMASHSSPTENATTDKPLDTQSATSQLPREPCGPRQYPNTEIQNPMATSQYATQPPGATRSLPISHLLNPPKTVSRSGCNPPPTDSKTGPTSHPSQFPSLTAVSPYSAIPWTETSHDSSFSSSFSGGFFIATSLGKQSAYASLKSVTSYQKSTIQGARHACDPHTARSVAPDQSSVYSTGRNPTCSSSRPSIAHQEYHHQGVPNQQSYPNDSVFENHHIPHHQNLIHIKSPTQSFHQRDSPATGYNETPMRWDAHFEPPYSTRPNAQSRYRMEPPEGPPVSPTRLLGLGHAPVQTYGTTPLQEPEHHRVLNSPNTLRFSTPREYETNGERRDFQQPSEQASLQLDSHQFSFAEFNRLQRTQLAHTTHSQPSIPVPTQPTSHYSQTRLIAAASTSVPLDDFDMFVEDKLTRSHAVPPELPPSVEEAYRKKCIQLKTRLNQVEEANDASRLRIERLNRAIEKGRLERAFLLEQLAKRTSTNVEDSEGSPSPPPTVCRHLSHP